VQGPSTFAAAAFEPVLRLTTAEEFVKTFGANVSRLLKRSPDALMPLLLRLLAPLAGDCSRLLDELLTPLLAEMLASAKDDTRRSRVQRALVSLVAKVRQPAALQKVAQQLLDAWAGKVAGALALPAQRLAVLAVLRALLLAADASGVAGEALKKLVGANVTALAESLKKDTNREVRKQGLRLIVSLQLRPAVLASDAFLAVWLAALKDKDAALAPAVLQALTTLALEGGRAALVAAKEGKEVVQATLKLLQAAVASPAQLRAQGLQAATTLAALSPVGAADAESAWWNEAGAQQPQHAEGGLLYSLTHVRKGGEEEGASLWQLARVLLLKHANRLHALPATQCDLSPQPTQFAWCFLISICHSVPLHSQPAVCGAGCAAVAF
jgi:hypothetical protein